MSTDRDFDRVASAWLAEGPGELADRVLDSALDEVHLTKQRRRLPVPWRTPRMNLLLRLGAAVAVIAVAGLGALSLGRSSSGPAATLSPSISPPPSTPAGVLDTSDWIAFTSERYGFDIKRHPALAEVPSSDTWQMSEARNCCTVATERFWHGPGGSRALSIDAWSVSVTPGSTLESWFQTWCDIPADLCPTDRSLDRAVPVVTADGHPGVSITKPVRGLVEPYDSSVAFVPVRDRMYVVTVTVGQEDPLVSELGGTGRIIEAFVSTMALRPEGPAPEASPPALTGSFTSERYGYSVRFPDSVWTAIPASETWVPGHGQRPQMFDLLESTIGFRGASAVVPDGVGVDDWITRTATASDTTACAPSRPTLGDIKIDGQIGKVRMSCEEIEATVVVDGRLYMFTLHLAKGEPWSTAGGRALFEAMIATVQLTPEAAEVAASTAP